MLQSHMTKYKCHMSGNSQQTVHLNAQSWTELNGTMPSGEQAIPETLPTDLIPSDTYEQNTPKLSKFNRVCKKKIRTITRTTISVQIKMEADNNSVYQDSVDVSKSQEV